MSAAADICTIADGPYTLLSATAGTIENTGTISVAIASAGARGINAMGTQSFINLNNVTITSAVADIGGINASSGAQITIGGNLSSQSAGTGVTASGGASIAVFGNAIVSSSQNNAPGIYATGVNSTITLANANISTSGLSSYGVQAGDSGRVTLTGTTTITISGGSNNTDITSNLGGAGLLATSSGILTSMAGTTVTITMAGSSNSGNANDRIYGVLASQGGQMLLDSDVNITMTGNFGWGGRVQDAGTNLITTGNLSIKASRGLGLLVTNGGRATLNGDQNIIEASNTGGGRTGGFDIDAGGILTVNSRDTQITVHGSNYAGIYVHSSGSQANFTGDLTIKTDAAGSYGIYATNTGTFTQTGSTSITTNGVNSTGVYAITNARVNFNGTGTTTIVVNGNAGTGTTVTAGLYSSNGSQITSAAGTSLNITLNGNANGTNRPYGILAGGTGGRIQLDGTTSVTVNGLNGFGLRGGETGVLVVNGNLAVTALQGTGIQSTDAAIVTIAGALTTIDARSQSGSITNGILVSGTSTFNLDSAQTNITTSGANAYGIQIQGSGNQLNLNGAVRIETDGASSHGFYLTSAATRTFDGTTSASGRMPDFIIRGPGSAVVAANGTGSLFTLTGTAALNMGMTAGADTWGALAISSGRVRFSGTSSTGGTGLWANSGVIDLWGSADAAGSRVLLQGTGVLNFETTGTSTLQIGSLEGESTTTVQLNNHTLSIGSNNTGNNGTLIDNANFAGSFTGAGSLIKTGTLTQILSGAGNTVGSVQVTGGTLSFQQNGLFSTTGNYTTATGATTVIGLNNSKLSVGGIFTQASGSTLNVTLGASPDITAATAQLDGSLVINGFAAGPQPVKASEIENQAYTLIRTTGGITGNFTNNPLAPSSIDYLTQEGYVSANGLDYNLGFQLAWTKGGQAFGTGNFTMASGTGFEVDVVLSNQTVPPGGFNSGWDGQSLVKAGAGTLILSRQNTYTGSTTLNGGTLQTNIANAFADSNAVIVNGGVLDLNGFGQTAHEFSGTGGEIRLTGGAQLLADNTGNTSFAGSLTGTGSLYKQGAGQLTLTGGASYGGGTTVAAGTLSIGNGGTGGSITGDILNDATLIFNRSNASGYDGVLSGSGDLIKRGGGVLSLTGGGSAQGSVDVEVGTLSFGQSGAFSVTGDYTTRSGATTALGFEGATLAIGGVFTQESGSTLNALLGASPDITASSAQLSGTLIISGFNDTAAPVTASAATSQQYIMIRTTGGITGDFVNNPIGPNSLDYLLYDGHVTVSGLEYELGFRMAWLEGDQATGTGNFTMGGGTAFDVDIPLHDMTVPLGGFDSGWDGRSLVKGGAGLLLLSAQNTYTGTTTVNDGTLKFDIANSIATSSDMIVNGGIVDLNGYSQQFNRLAGTGGEIILNGATLTAENATGGDATLFAGTISGSGTFVKAGAGSLTLTGQTLWQGPTLLNGGQLILDGQSGGARLTSDIVGQNGTLLELRNGAVLTGSIDPADVSIDATSLWHMTASSEVGTLTLAGKIEFPELGAAAASGRTLVAHNWHGQGGSVFLSSVLGNDGSVTDRLVIDGGQATGTTNLVIRNAGGLGALTTGNGILVVEAVNGAQTTLDAPSAPSQSQTFRLGQRIAAGAYEYQLFSGGNTATGGNGGDQNWYLRSYDTSGSGSGGAAVFRPEVPTNAVIQPLALEYGYAMLDTLHERMGASQAMSVAPVYEERSFRCNDARQNHTCVVKVPVSASGKDAERWAKSGWARLIGNRGFQNANNFSERGPDYNYTFGGIQAGLDIYAREQADGTLDKVGLYVGYGQISATVKGQPGAYYGGKAGSVDMDAYTLGAYWTHFSPSGWYTDAVVQGTWYSADARSVSGQQIKPEGFGFLASLEGGYSFRLGDGWTIEPQAQLVYQNVSFDKAQDAFGRFSFDDGESLRARLGVRVSKSWALAEDSKTPRLVTAWVRGNIWHEFMGGTKTVANTFDGSHPVFVASSLGGTWGEIGAGISGQISENVTLFASTSYQHSFDNRGRQAWNGRIGAEIRW